MIASQNDAEVLGTVVAALASLGDPRVNAIIKPLKQWLWPHKFYPQSLQQLWNNRDKGGNNDE